MKNQIVLTFLLLTYVSEISPNGQDDSEAPRKSCYGDLGCLETDSIWYNPRYRPENRIPFDRFVIKTDFLVIKKNATFNDFRDLYYTSASAKNESIKASGFERDKHVVFLIHDYTSNGFTGWVKHLSAVLLDYQGSPYNLISVDWQHGAKPPYDQAIANARVVGLEVVNFITVLTKSFHVQFDHISIIGHGVGAHIAGYVGTVYNTINQISGLDPSGPRFEGMPDAVKLNPSRAKYVEVIHTDAFDKYSQGTLEKMGHSDFYINNAGLQPGCEKNTASLINEKLADGVIMPGCSHKRAFKYFIEAMYNGECLFLGINCSSLEKFEKGKCTSCGNEGELCRTFGLADEIGANSPKKVAYYLSTRATPPYCMFQYEVTVKIANTGKSHDGFFDFIFVDESKMVVHAVLPGRKHNIFKSGMEQSLIYYAPPPLLAKLIEAKVRWNEDVKFYCLLYCEQSIRVQWITVTTVFLHNKYSSFKTKLCLRTGANTDIENGNYVTFIPC